MFSTNIRTRYAGIRTFATAVRTRPTVRDLLRTPVFKSLFLTFVFGTVVVDVMRGRRELEKLKTNHEIKFEILEDVKRKLKNGEKVDIARELKLARTLSKEDHDSDIEVDDQIENWFKMLDEEDNGETREKANRPEKKSQVLESKQPIEEERRVPIKTSKFL